MPSILTSIYFQNMSNHENDDEVAGPSIMGSDDRRYSGPDTAELTNAQTIIEMLQVGFNGASSTGLSQDDMELSSKTKWLILDPNYYPRDPEGRFFFKLSEWTD